MVHNKSMETNCSLCNNQLRIKLIENIKKYDSLYNVYFCKECIVGLTFPIPSTEDLSRLYSLNSYRLNDGKRFNPLIEYFIYIFRQRRKKEIQKYVTKGHILDIGCGRGLFLNVMRNNGWNVTGVEFDKETSLCASDAYDINVIPQESIDNLPDERFDVITLYHVLEHLDNPVAVIHTCRRLLRKGGLLVISVPNIFSLQASVGKGVWFHLDLPCHLHHFSEGGLTILLNKNSFKILKIKRFNFEYNPFGWLQTLLNISGISENLLYNLLKLSKLRKREILNINKKDLILTLILLPLYFPLSFVLSAFESFFLKRGGTFDVYAAKE